MNEMTLERERQDTAKIGISGLRHSTRPFPRPRNCRAICRNAGASMRLIFGIRTPNAFLGAMPYPRITRPATACAAIPGRPMAAPRPPTSPSSSEQLLDPLGTGIRHSPAAGGGEVRSSTQSNSASRSAPRSMTGRSTNGSTRRPRLKGFDLRHQRGTPTAPLPRSRRGLPTSRFGADLGAVPRALEPAGRKALLAALRGGRPSRPADRHAFGGLRQPGQHRQRLDVLLHRGTLRLLQRQPDRADQHDLRGCLRRHPRPEARAGRGWLRLAAAADVAHGPRMGTHARRASAC